MIETLFALLLATVCVAVYLYRDRGRARSLLAEALPLFEERARLDEIDRLGAIAEQHFFEQTPGWDGFDENAYKARFQGPRSHGPTSWATATHCADGTPYDQVDPATLAETRTIPLKPVYAVHRRKAGLANPYAMFPSEAVLKSNPNDAAQNSRSPV